MRKTLLFSGMILCLMACSQIDNDLISELTESQQPQSSGNSMKYTLDEALANMYEFLDGVDDGTTRSSNKRVVAESYVIGNPNPTTRSQRDKDSLLYLVNFANEGGFAILAADKRFDEVLAIGDEGSSFPFEMLKKISTGIEIDQNEEEDLNLFLARLVSGHMSHFLMAEEFATRASGPGTNPTNPNPTNPNPNPGENHNWIYRHRIYPFVLTKWVQYTPFSDVLSERKGKKIGCLNLAVSQICVYWGRPSSFVGENNSAIRFNMNELKNSCYTYKPGQGLYVGSAATSRKASEYIYEIYTDLGISKTQNGHEGRIAWFFERHGFTTSVCYRKHSMLMPGLCTDINEFYPQIRTALLNRIPVYISGDSNDVLGHAWVLDGLLERYYIDESTRKIVEQSLVHCNFGYGGSGDGYYNYNFFNIWNPMYALVDGYEERWGYGPHESDYIVFENFTAVIPTPNW